MFKRWARDIILYQLSCTLRGFSGLTATLVVGAFAFTRVSSLLALVLNAPQDLHASMTRSYVESQATGSTAGFFVAGAVPADSVFRFFGAMGSFLEISQTLGFYE